jgi:hypothetical protein
MSPLYTVKLLWSSFLRPQHFSLKAGRAAGGSSLTEVGGFTTA